MNDLIIQFPEIIQAGGTIQAESIFEKINSLAADGEETAKVVFGAGFVVGAVIQWVKNKFSVASGIAGIILAAIGIAILSQMSVFQQSFEDTIPDEASVVNESTHLDAQPQLEDLIVLTADDLGRAA
jgi:hypothetical protein